MKIKKGLARESTVRSQLDLKSLIRPDKQQKSRFKPRLFLALFLLLILALIAIGLKCYLDKPDQPDFLALTNDQKVIYALIDQKALYDQARPFYRFLKENYFYAPAIGKISGYFKQAGINYQEALNLGFEKQVGFILLPANNDSPFPFILVFKKQAGFSNLQNALNQLSGQLKKDFNYNIEPYRQIEMVTLKTLRETEPGFPKSYAYAQIKGYFIISNSPASVKQAIDNLLAY